MTTEAEILSREPYTDPKPPQTIEALAGELVDAIMLRLQTLTQFRDVMELMSQEQMQPVDNDLMSHAIAVLRNSPLVRTAPALPTLPAVPLEPPEDGPVFTVQVGGGLLLSEQAVAEQRKP